MARLGRLLDIVREVVFISPHPPDALPVQVTGLMAAHRTRMEAILDEPALETVLAGSTHSDQRYLEIGAEPSFPEAAYGGAIMPALLASMLLVSWLAALLTRRLSRSAWDSSTVSAGW